MKYMIITKTILKSFKIHLKKINHNFKVVKLVSPMMDKYLIRGLSY